MDFPTPVDIQERGYVLTGFIDPGGSIDDYFFTVLKTDLKKLHSQVYGAMHWLLDEKNGVDFGRIRNDIAKLHLRNYFNLIGCELNNFGRGEVQQMRREYQINMYGVNTSGKVTSEEIIKKQKTMDKHQMVKWANSWRADGHITFPRADKQTPEIKKIIHQLDSFVVKKTDGSGGPTWKYGAEGTQHDDGIMSLLGNLYIVKEKFLRISGYGPRAVGTISRPAANTAITSTAKGDASAMQIDSQPAPPAATAAAAMGGRVIGSFATAKKSSGDWNGF